MTAKSPARPTRPQPRVHRAFRARRGSIYAVVMGMSIIVALIGLSTIAVSRINLRSTAVVGESGEAELLALSAVEHATSVVNSNPSWRTDFTHNVEIPSVQLGRGIFTWKLRDEIDGNLSGGGLQPVNVVGYGFVGPARRAFSVQLLPAGPNLLTNGEVEQGLTGWAVNAADCVLESHTTATAAGEVPHGGTRFVWVKSRINQYAGPQQSMLNKITKGSGRSYYFEAWVKMTASPEPVWFTLLIKQGGSGPSDVTEKVRATEVAGTEWTKVSATYVPTWTGSETDVLWRIETGATAQDFFFDDVKVMNDAANTPMKPSLGSWKQVPADDVAAAAASSK
ncbi:MAG TPA: carbohydrate binding domain-containing protein [Tepidisphaeraceae bacterium]|nr:carbohydrate binding domain-containing protein [Tepidisphaeraceae bacterium]